MTKSTKATANTNTTTNATTTTLSKEDIVSIVEQTMEGIISKQATPPALIDFDKRLSDMERRITHNVSHRLQKSIDEKIADEKSASAKDEKQFGSWTKRFRSPKRTGSALPDPETEALLSLSRNFETIVKMVEGFVSGRMASISHANKREKAGISVPQIIREIHDFMAGTISGKYPIKSAEPYYEQAEKVFEYIGRKADEANKRNGNDSHQAWLRENKRLGWQDAALNIIDNLLGYKPSKKEIAQYNELEDLEDMLIQSLSNRYNRYKDSRSSHKDRKKALQWAIKKANA